MGKIISRNNPCKLCSSSDAAQAYDDGLTHCFSCGKTYKTDSTEPSNFNPNYKSHSKETVAEVLSYPITSNPDRLLIKPVVEFYGVRASFSEDGTVDKYYYPFTEIGSVDISGFKYKDVKDKKNQRAVGTVKNLFGLEHFLNGGKRIIITEGEEDCLAVQTANYKRWNKFYPVVSMGGAQATKYLVENRETLRKFDEIILWFDNDEQGQKAVKEAAFILGYDKVKVVKSDLKDANDVLKAGGLKEGPNQILNLVFDAQPFQPAGLITHHGELWGKLVEYEDKESVPYPEFMSGLNDKLKGIRLGEITLLTSGTGAGKTTLTREILLHIKNETADLPNPPKLGLIALEDSPAESARIMAGMELNRNPKAEEIPLNELKEGFDKVFGDDRFVILDHSGSVTDNSILELLEYMCLSGVKYIILDHITILISEGVEGKSGLEAQDAIMAGLLRIVKKHDVWIGLVSHLRKTSGGTSFEEGHLPSLDDIRGSGSTKQISMDIIAFARNSIAKEEKERNTIKLRVLKCRYTGLTGDAGYLQYNYNTGRLSASDGFKGDDEDFEIIE